MGSVSFFIFFYAYAIISVISSYFYRGSEQLQNVTTWGTWGNNPTGLGNGLFKNLEIGRISDASRSFYIDDKKEVSLNELIKGYQSKGASAWQLGAPCSSFAKDAWEAGTGENLNSNYGPISNPTTLKESIIKANGGKPHLNTSTVNNKFSAPSPSSSLHFSGSSFNSIGWVFQ